MPVRATFRQIGRGVRRALRVAAAPVRRRGYHEGVVVQPYRGYGTREEVLLKGRVFRQPRIGTRFDETTVVRDVADIVRRIARLGMGGAELTVRFQGAETRVETDRDGYFQVRLRPASPPPADRRWHELELSLEHDGEIITEKGDVFIPPETSRFVVISDIDDTVVRTGVANTAKMMYRLFVQGAESRVAFPGVAALYRALHRGVSGDEQNPMLYVSRGPWSIYEVLVEFFHLHRIPEGPVLFLREWGLTFQRPLPKRATNHKQDLIEEMLACYGDLPVILIGDSGQHDPEVYARVVHDHPDRVLAIYIRNVSRRARRWGEIEKLAREVENAGIDLVLADGSFAMARHAAEQGFISPEDLVEVMEERLEEAPEKDSLATAAGDASGLPDETIAEKRDTTTVAGVDDR